MFACCLDIVAEEGEHEPGRFFWCGLLLIFLFFLLLLFVPAGLGLLDGHLDGAGSEHGLQVARHIVEDLPGNLWKLLCLLALLPSCRLAAKERQGGKVTRALNVGDDNQQGLTEQRFLMFKEKGSN